MNAQNADFSTFIRAFRVSVLIHCLLFTDYFYSPFSSFALICTPTVLNPEST